MPGILQRAMDYSFFGLKDTYCLLDDIIIVSNGSKGGQFRHISSCLKKLEKDNLRINHGKCNIAKSNVNWFVILSIHVNSHKIYHGHIPS